MPTISAFQSNHIDVSYDPEGAWVYADWKGYQSDASIRDGCEQILQVLIRHKLVKVLSDNTGTRGIWADMAGWIGQHWIPAAVQAGMKHFALVYGPSEMTRFSADRALDQVPLLDLSVCTFDTRNEAEIWLRSRD